MARGLGVQIEQNYNNEYGGNRLSEIELRELYETLRDDIEELEGKF